MTNLLIIEAFKPVGQTGLLTSECQIRTPRRTGPVTPTKSWPSRNARKRSTYSPACSNVSTHFTPFVVSTYGLIGREAGELLKTLSLRLADNNDVLVRYCYCTGSLHPAKRCGIAQCEFLKNIRCVIHSFVDARPRTTHFYAGRVPYRVNCKPNMR
jgi:hypothetical protein